MLAVERTAHQELARIPDWLWDRKSAPVPVESIADSHYGLMIGERDELGAWAGTDGGAVSGLLVPSRKEIWVNAEEAARAPARRRFTIGHELGHWVLHCLAAGVGGDAIYCRHGQVREEAAGESAEVESTGARIVDAKYPPEELDANQFAAAMLMPRDLVIDEHRRLDGDEQALCRRFGVSPLAMQRRLWFISATLGST